MLAAVQAPDRTRRPHTLVVRPGGTGTILLQGPAVRAVAARSRRVTMACEPWGATAAARLPGVDELLILPGDLTPEPDPDLVRRVGRLGADQALVLADTPSRSLPLARLLRAAGVPRIGALGRDLPGWLVDVRHLPDEGDHEVLRSCGLAAAMGMPAPPGDDRRLAVLRRGRLPDEIAELAPYVVIHPGASSEARAWSPDHHAQLARLLVAWGRRVVVTGTRVEAGLCEGVAGPPRPEVLNLAGRTDLDLLAEVLAGGDVVVSGNGAPAHLAAAVGTPLVSLFSPVVPASRWRPWRVPHVLLGRQDAGCAGTGADVCPLPGHPCLNGVDAYQALTAIQVLAAERSSPVLVPASPLST